MLFLAIVIAALLVASFRLSGRYEYGSRTRRLLGLVLAGSFLVAFFIAYYHYGISSGIYLSLATVGITIPVFVFAAFGLVEFLRLGKQQVYGKKLEALRVREQAVLDHLAELDRRLRRSLREGETADRARQSREKELEMYRRRVDTWKREGGAARIRSLKLEEWTEELRKLTSEELAVRRREAEKELVETSDPERRSHLQVMIALAVLTAESSSLERAVSTSSQVRRDVTEASEERRRAEEELGHIREEMRAVRRSIEDFLSKEIRLD